MTFTVVDNATFPASYVLCGIIFGKTKRAGILTLPPKTGRDNFPDFECKKDGTLEVRDEKKDPGLYQFLLVVQNDEGGVGIIDPQISNQ